MKLPTYTITVNNRPYLGESNETVDAFPRSSGWTGKSPSTRTRISLGEVASGTGKLITGRKCLRSELERILAEVDSGLTIEKIEIFSVLAEEIQSGDGVANAAILEASQRLKEQEWEIAGLIQKTSVNSTRAEEIISARETEIARQHERIKRLTLALKDAISTYSPDRKETLVTAERQEAWINALNQ